jgi:transposase
MARPRFRPLDEQRRLVKMLAGIGISHQKIALLLGVSHKTLTKHLRNELDHGSIEAEAEIAKSLFEMARGKNLAAIIAFLKAKGWWASPGSETQKEPVTDFVVVIDKKAA